MTQRLGDLIAQAPIGIERRERVLEDHLHLAPRLAQIDQAPSLRISPAVEPDCRRIAPPPDAGSTGRSVDLPQPDSPTSDKRLADIDREADVFDRMDVRDRAAEDAALHRKARRQVADLQQRLRPCRDGRGAAALRARPPSPSLRMRRRRRPPRASRRAWARPRAACGCSPRADSRRSARPAPPRRSGRGTSRPRGPPSAPRRPCRG